MTRHKFSPVIIVLSLILLTFPLMGYCEENCCYSETTKDMELVIENNAIHEERPTVEIYKITYDSFSNTYRYMYRNQYGALVRGSAPANEYTMIFDTLSIFDTPYLKIIDCYYGETNHSKEPAETIKGEHFATYYHFYVPSQNILQEIEI